MSMPVTESMTPDLEPAWPCERVRLADHTAAYL